MKRINSIFLIIPFLIGILSCGGPSTRDKSLEDNSFTVDWSQVDKKPVPKIEDQSILEVGPAPLENEKSYTTKSQKPKTPTALVLGPGVYRSLAHIALLKEIRLNNKEPQVILGHGLSSIVAAYFAFGYEPDYIEWKFFKFINKLDDETPLSKEWLKIAEDTLLDELAGKRIEEGKLTLLVPIKDLRTNKILFKKRGPLLRYLLANIDHRGIYSKSLRPAFMDTFVEQKPLLNLGVGRIVGVDLLTEGISWKMGSGFLNGIFEKGASVTLKSKQKLDIMITYPLNDFKVDNKSDVADLVYKSKNLAREKLELLNQED